MSKTYSRAVLLLLGLVFWPAIPLPAAPPGTQPAAPGTQPAPPVVTVTLTDAKLPVSPGYFVVHAQARAAEKTIPLRIGIFLPAAYFKTKDPFPMVVALHNRGWEQGDASVPGEGLESLWIRDSDERTVVQPAVTHPATTRSAATRSAIHPATLPAPKPVLVRKDARFVGVAPQLPVGMDFETPPMPQIVAAAMDAIAAKYRVDQNREYLTGFSYGGTSTWRIAEQVPNQFAAIVPISGRAMADPKATIARLKGVPIYLASGTQEWATDTCKIMADALKAQEHPDYVYRLIDGGNHFCYPRIYQDPSFWDWLFARKRATAAPANTPVQDGAGAAHHT